MTVRFRPALLPALLGLACAPAESADRGARVELLDVPAVRVDTTGAAGIYRAAGTVRSARRAELATRLVGRVESVAVRPGDRVRTGQLLLTVERASLTAAERQAASAVELASANLRRVERLYADSAMPLVQLESARDALAQAEGQVRAVRADLGYADIRAPFDGMVASRLVDPGDNAAPGQPLLVIEDRGAREIVVTVPDELRQWLRPGQEVAVEIGAGRQRVTARTLAVVVGADPQSPTVELRLAGPADLTPGLPAVAEIPMEARNVLLIPVGALLERGQLDGVYVFAPDSTLRLRWVRLGRARGDSVEVVSGLRPGDLLAADGAGAREGTRARPILPAGADR
jgi:RND family efflux transporter MFP subunit